eukprot:jgi/Bigna1/89872/estExt_fgenesh1_pg.C_570032
MARAFPPRRILRTAFGSGALLRHRKDDDVMEIRLSFAMCYIAGTAVSEDFPKRQLPDCKETAQTKVQGNGKVFPRKRYPNNARLEGPESRRKQRPHRKRNTKNRAAKGFYIMGRFNLKTLERVLMRRKWAKFIPDGGADHWNLYWGSVSSCQHRCLLNQKVNGFENHLLSSKDDMEAQLRRAEDLIDEKFKGAFDFRPKTWILPKDKKAMCEFLRASRSKEQLYIAKPSGLNRGQGIFLFRTREEYEEMQKKQASLGIEEFYVVQKYVEDPLLIYGYKFDLRLYVLITSFWPTRIYLYNNGLVRFCSEPYRSGAASEEDIRNPYRQLTNYSVNKKNEAIREGLIDEDGSISMNTTSDLNSETKGGNAKTAQALRDEDNGSADSADRARNMTQEDLFATKIGSGAKWTFKQLRAYVEEHPADFPGGWVLILTLTKWRKTEACFRYLASISCLIPASVYLTQFNDTSTRSHNMARKMLTDARWRWPCCQPILLESNGFPSLHSTTELDKSVKVPLLNDLFSLLRWEMATGRSKGKRGEEDNVKEESYAVEAVLEVRGSGNWLINGEYKASGRCNGAYVFAKIFRNYLVTISLAESSESGNRLWWISRVDPYTTTGKEFHYCTCTAKSKKNVKMKIRALDDPGGSPYLAVPEYLPPRKGWKIHSGMKPSPTIVYKKYREYKQPKDAKELSRIKKILSNISELDESKRGGFERILPQNSDLSKQTMKLQKSNFRLQNRFRCFKDVLEKLLRQAMREKRKQFSCSCVVARGNYFHALFQLWPVWKRDGVNKQLIVCHKHLWILHASIELVHWFGSWVDVIAFVQPMSLENRVHRATAEQLRNVRTKHQFQAIEVAGLSALEWVRCRVCSTALSGNVTSELTLFPRGNVLLLQCWPKPRRAPELETGWVLSVHRKLGNSASLCARQAVRDQDQETPGEEQQKSIEECWSAVRSQLEVSNHAKQPAGVRRSATSNCTSAWHAAPSGSTGQVLSHRLPLRFDRDPRLQLPQLQRTSQPGGSNGGDGGSSDGGGSCDGNSSAAGCGGDSGGSGGVGSSSDGVRRDPALTSHSRNCGQWQRWGVAGSRALPTLRQTRCIHKEEKDTAARSGGPDDDDLVRAMQQTVSSRCIPLVQSAPHFLVLLMTEDAIELFKSVMKMRTRKEVESRRQLLATGGNHNVGKCKITAFVHRLTVFKNDPVCPLFCAFHHDGKLSGLRGSVGSGSVCFLLGFQTLNGNNTPRDSLPLHLPVALFTDPTVHLSVPPLCFHQLGHRRILQQHVAPSHRPQTRERRDVLAGCCLFGSVERHRGLQERQACNQGDRSDAAVTWSALTLELGGDGPKATSLTREKLQELNTKDFEENPAKSAARVSELHNALRQNGAEPTLKGAARCLKSSLKPAHECSTTIVALDSAGTARSLCVSAACDTCTTCFARDLTVMTSFQVVSRAMKTHEEKGKLAPNELGNVQKSIASALECDVKIIEQVGKLANLGCPSRQTLAQCTFHDGATSRRATVQESAGLTQGFRLEGVATLRHVVGVHRATQQALRQASAKHTWEERAGQLVAPSRGAAATMKARKRKEGHTGQLVPSGRSCGDDESQETQDRGACRTTHCAKWGSCGNDCGDLKSTSHGLLSFHFFSRTWPLHPSQALPHEGACEVGDTRVADGVHAQGFEVHARWKPGNARRSTPDNSLRQAGELRFDDRAKKQLTATQQSQKEDDDKKSGLCVASLHQVTRAALQGLRRNAISGDNDQKELPQRTSVRGDHKRVLTPASRDNEGVKSPTFPKIRVEWQGSLVKKTHPHFSHSLPHQRCSRKVRLRGRGHKGPCRVRWKPQRTGANDVFDKKRLQGPVGEHNETRETFPMHKDDELTGVLQCVKADKCSFDGGRSKHHGGGGCTPPVLEGLCTGDLSQSRHLTSLATLLFHTARERPQNVERHVKGLKEPLPACKTKRSVLSKGSLQSTERRVEGLKELLFARKRKRSCAQRDIDVERNIAEGLGVWPVLQLAFGSQNVLTAVSAIARACTQRCVSPRDFLSLTCSRLHGRVCPHTCKPSATRASPASRVPAAARVPSDGALCAHVHPRASRVAVQHSLVVNDHFTCDTSDNKNTSQSFTNSCEGSITFNVVTCVFSEVPNRVNDPMHGQLIVAGVSVRVHCLRCSFRDIVVFGFEVCQQELLFAFVCASIPQHAFHKRDAFECSWDIVHVCANAVGHAMHLKVRASDLLRWTSMQLAVRAAQLRAIACELHALQLRLATFGTAQPLQQQGAQGLHRSHPGPGKPFGPRRGNEPVKRQKQGRKWQRGQKQGLQATRATLGEAARWSKRPLLRPPKQQRASALALPATTKTAVTKVCHTNVPGSVVVDVDADADTRGERQSMEVLGLEALFSRRTEEEEQGWEGNVELGLDDERCSTPLRPLLLCWWPRAGGADRVKVNSQTEECQRKHTSAHSQTETAKRHCQTAEELAAPTGRSKRTKRTPGAHGAHLRKRHSHRIDKGSWGATWTNGKQECGTRSRPGLLPAITVLRRSSVSVSSQKTFSLRSSPLTSSQRHGRCVPRLVQKPPHRSPFVVTKAFSSSFFSHDRVMFVAFVFVKCFDVFCTLVFCSNTTFKIDQECER